MGIHVDHRYRCISIQPFWRTNWQYFPKYAYLNPGIPFLSIYPRKIFTHVHRVKRIRVLIAAMLMIAKCRNHPIVHLQNNSWITQSTIIPLDSLPHPSWMSEEQGNFMEEIHFENNIHSMIPLVQSKM